MVLRNTAALGDLVDTRLSSGAALAGALDEVSEHAVTTVEIAFDWRVAGFTGLGGVEAVISCLLDGGGGPAVLACRTVDDQPSFLLLAFSTLGGEWRHWCQSGRGVGVEESFHDEVVDRDMFLAKKCDD